MCVMMNIVSLVFNNNNEITMDSVTDRNGFGLTLFFFLGSLLRLNVNFLTIYISFFLYEFYFVDGKFPQEDEFGEFESKFSLIAGLSRLAFTIAVLVRFHRTPYFKRFHVCLVCLFVSFLTLAVLTLADTTDIYVKDYENVVLAVGFFASGAEAVYLISLFQLSSKFPPSYVAVMMTGMSCGEIYSGFVKVVGAQSPDPEVAGFVNFLMAAILVTAVSGVLFHLGDRSAYFKSVVSRAIEEQAEIKADRARVGRVFKEVWVLFLTVLVVAGTDAMVHPGLTISVRSVDRFSEWDDLYFTPVVSILMAGLVQLFGRMAAHKFPYKGPIYVLCLLGVVRMCFIPLFMYCNVQGRNHLPVVFDSDWIYAVFVIVFMFSNGYMINSCLLRLSTATADSGDVKISSLIVVAGLLLGLQGLSAINPLIKKGV